MTKKEQLRRRIIELTGRENVNSFVITKALNSLKNWKQYWLKSGFPNDCIISIHREERISDGIGTPLMIEEKICIYQENGAMIDTLDDQTEETINALHQLLITE